MIRKYLHLAFLIAALLALDGCHTYKMSVLEGDFDARVAPAMRGAEFAMDSGSTIRRLSVSVHPMKDKSVDLVNVWNKEVYVCDLDGECEATDDYDLKLDERKADIDYILKSFPISIDLEWMNKFETVYTAYGFGLDPLPYAKASFGANFRYGEIGVSTFWGLDYGKATYKYEGVFVSGGCIMCVSPEPEYTTGENSDSYLHFRGGIGAYASLFLGPVALVYVPSLTKPWLWRDDLEGKAFQGVEPMDDYDISFAFPWFITNYFGVTYTLNKVVQFRVGVSIVNGKQLADREYYGSASASWLF